MSETRSRYFSSPKTPALPMLHDLGKRILSTETRFDSGNKYDHALRVAGILEDTVADIPYTLIAAAYIHDLIDREDPKEPHYTTILNGFAEAFTADPEFTLYAFGFAYSAEQFKQQAELWRGEVIRHLVPTAEPVQFLETSLGRIVDKQLSEYGFLGKDGSDRARSEDILRLKRKLRFAIGDKNGLCAIDKELKELRPPMAEVPQMLEALSTWDIEGLLLAAAENIDKVGHPNQHKPAATWRDAQDLLFFFGPLVEVAGFKKLAMMCYSTALTYLNEDMITSKDHPQRQAVYNEAVDLYISTHRTLLQQFKSFHPLVQNVDCRLKTEGSVLEKLREKPNQGNTLPDLIGFEIVLSDASTPQDMVIVISQIYATVLSLQEFQPGHTRAGEPTIEINIDGFTDLHAEALVGTLQSFVDTPIVCKVSGARPSSYEAIHISFKHSASKRVLVEERSRNEANPDLPVEEVKHTIVPVEVEVGMEIKVVTEKMKRRNEYGAASHFMYKVGKEGMGPFPELKRRGEEEITKRNNGQSFDQGIIDDYESTRDQFVGMIEAIHERVETFKERSKLRLSRLTPASLLAAMEILSTQLDYEAITEICPDFLDYICRLYGEPEEK